MERPVPTPRPEIQLLSPEVHGALDYIELERQGLDPDQVLDFSVNSSAYGPSPSVLRAVAQVPLDRYPDREAWGLRRALAEYLDLLVDQLIVGNGTAELIWLLALVYLRPGDRVLVVGPTFGEYANAARLMGAAVETWLARPATGFTPEPGQIEDMLKRQPYRLVFLCTPNNPTGQVFPLEPLSAWTKAYPGTLFVVDEAYIYLAGLACSAISLQAPNVVVLRSMTKDYALAGLRLGYAAAAPEVIAALACARPPWSVNALAQAAGVAALEDQGHLWGSQAKLRRNKQALVIGLETLGYTPLPSATHFFMLPVGDGRTFRCALLAQGILVRDCASFGLPDYVRIAARKPEENLRLLEAVRGVHI